MTDNGSLNLGSAHGSVIIDISGVQSAMTQAQSIFDRGLSSIGDSITRFGDQMSGLGVAITKLTAPLAAFGATGVKVAADFETVMTSIKVFGGVTTKELEAVRQQVLKWGADTVFSAQDAGEAMLNLLKAGMSVKDATATMPAILQLAVVGNMSLADASRVVMQTMNQYGLKAKDTIKIVNALAKADNASAASVSELGQSLVNVGPLAKRYGLTVEDTAAIMAIFADNGIRGATAGQQLESMLTMMQKPTKRAQQAWKALGTSLYDANGQIRPFNQVLKEMKKGFDKLNPEQQNQILQQIAGSYGQMGLAALLASDGFDTMAKKMKQAPSAADVEASSVGTFNRMLENLRGSIETLQITILTPFMQNTLKPLVQQVTDFINKLTDWANKNPVLAQQFVQFGAALVVLGPLLFIAGQAISAIGVVVSFLLSPLGLLIGLIVAAAVHFGGLDNMIRLATTAAQQLLQIALYEVARVLKEASDTAQTLGKIGLVLVTKGLNDAANAADQLLKLGLLLVTDTLNKAAGAAGMLATMLILFVAKGLNDAATAADQLLKMGLLLIVDTLNKASIAAGMLGLLLQTLVIKVVTDLRNAAFDLAGRLAEVSTNVGYLITGLTLLLGVLVVARLIAMVQALATAIIAVATAIAGGGGLMLALNPLTLVLVLVAGLTLAATTNFLGFGDRLKDVKRIIDEAVTSAKQLVAIMDELARRFNTSQGFNVQNTGLSGVTTGGTGFSITKSNQRYQAWKDSGGAGGPPDWFMPELRDWGGMGQKNIPYLITPKAGNELFVPQTNGTFLPHFDQIMAQLAGGNGNGGMQFAPGSIVINANSRAEGVAAADGFAERIEEIRARRGW